MKSLFKVGLIIGLIFASTFIIAKLVGVMSVEQIKFWFSSLHTTSPKWIALLVVGLLFADLFIAVPTLTVTILSGYFLGFKWGALAAITGMSLAGIAGYFLSYSLGEKILKTILKNEKERTDLTSTFIRSGFIMILLSRALPILPEVTACLAGITKMNFFKFIYAWSISTIPYALIASYSGSISTIDDPKPALFVAVGISATLWTLWYIYTRRMNKRTRPSVNI